MGEVSVDDALDELALAKEALADARVLANGGGSDSGIVNRLYYAAFHGAQAVLYTRGFNPSSHGHVRQLFGQEVVLGGDATRAEGRLLGTLYDYRQEADYGAAPSPVDATDLLSDVEGFVSRMEELVESEASIE